MNHLLLKAILKFCTDKKLFKKNTLSLKTKILKDFNYFRNKYQELKERKKFESFVSEGHRNALIASYTVSF